MGDGMVYLDKGMKLTVTKDRCRVSFYYNNVLLYVEL